GVDARGRGALPSVARTGAAAGRPPLLPAPLRRRAHARSLRRAPAPGDRARAADGRPAPRRRRDDGAGAPVDLAAGGALVSRVLAWSTAGAGVALAVAGSVVAALGHGNAETDSGAFFVLVLALIAAAAVVGGLVASRRPENPIGWIFCGFS